MRRLYHEFGEEIHPGLEVDVATAVYRPGEVIHS